MYQDNSRPITRINPLPDWALSESEKMDIVFQTVKIIDGERYMYDEYQEKLDQIKADEAEYRDKMKGLGLI